MQGCLGHAHTRACRRIIEWIDAAEGQVILTSPKETDVRVHGGSLPRWTIRDGVISDAR